MQKKEVPTPRRNDEKKKKTKPEKKREARASGRHWYVTLNSIIGGLANKDCANTSETKGERLIEKRSGRGKWQEGFRSYHNNGIFRRKTYPEKNGFGWKIPRQANGYAVSARTGPTRYG